MIKVKLCSLSIVKLNKTHELSEGHKPNLRTYQPCIPSLFADSFSARWVSLKGINIIATGAARRTYSSSKALKGCDKMHCLICGIVGVLVFLLTYIALPGLRIWLVTNTPICRGVGILRPFRAMKRYCLADRIDLRIVKRHFGPHPMPVRLDFQTNSPTLPVSPLL